MLWDRDPSKSEKETQLSVPAANLAGNTQNYISVFPVILLSNITASSERSFTDIVLIVLLHNNHPMAQTTVSFPNARRSSSNFQGVRQLAWRWKQAWLLLLVGVIFARVACGATAPDTYFLSNESTFSNHGDYWYQGFTVYSTSQFVLRFASDYSADVAVVRSGQLNNFTGGGAFSGYGILSGQIGTRYITLAPGSYDLVVRNRSNGSNRYDLELDHRQTAPADSQYRYQFNDLYLNHAAFVAANGGYLTQAFTIQSGFRYFMDGGNSGVDTYIIPAGQISNFRNNATFNYYTNYSGFGDVSQPGYYELNLSPGTYYLCFKNNDSIKKGVVYTLERWRIYNQPGDIALGGASSWNTSGYYVNIAVGQVVNNNSSGTSGSLRLRLWAIRSPYAGGSISGYVLGTRSLNPLPAGYEYTGVHGYVSYNPPPSGYYYTVITLEQYTASGWYISDYVAFNGTTHF